MVGGVMKKKAVAEFWYDKLKRECGNDWIAMGHKLVADQFPGIDEKEAIAYARGFTIGLLTAGFSKEKANATLDMVKFKDQLLNAGASYLGINIIQSIAVEVEGKKQ